MAKEFASQSSPYTASTLGSGMATPTELGEQTGDEVSFQSKELEELLNIIDELRAQGISRYIDLPQIIVCGDQSSGKSSVLEAVSGVRFPTKDNLCTRFPTELVLRRSSQVQSIVNIVPDARRPEHEQISLSKFRRDENVLQDFANIVESAGKAMGIDDQDKVFSHDVLRVELTGPKQPHLTLVDLPGLFHAGSKSQSIHDADAIKNMVTGYMEKSRSIILAVVSAKNDYNNQIVTRYAREVDPKGERTLGIITKPDTLPEGSDSERHFFELAQNKDVDLRLGWHVLKNRDYKAKDCSTEERDDAETDFFNKGIWTSLLRSQTGIRSLKPKLSRVLRDQILTELPGLVQDISSGIEECKSRIQRLGAARASQTEQKMYLHRVSQDFSRIVRDAVAGQYHNSFFSDSEAESGYNKRIRAIVMNLLDKFAAEMRMKGRQYIVVDNADQGSKTNRGTPIPISRDQRLADVSKLIKDNRGLELPGFQKYENISMLFREQSTPWKSIVQKYANHIFEDVRAALYLALDHAADPSTMDGISRLILAPALEDIKSDLDQRVRTNLEQHVTGHPITFNHYFTENLQKLRADHEIKSLTSRLQGFFGLEDSEDLTARVVTINIDQLARALLMGAEADMEKFTCSEALYFMEAYYKVALKFFVDDFVIHTIEEGLVGKLQSIFDPGHIFTLDEDKVATIAGETPESKSERASTGAKLSKLEEALRVLHGLDRGQSRSLKVQILETDSEGDGDSGTDESEADGDHDST